MVSLYNYPFVVSLYSYPFVVSLSNHEWIMVRTSLGYMQSSKQH